MRECPKSSCALLPPGEGGLKGRMRDLHSLRIPHPPLSRHPLPEGEGTRVSAFFLKHQISALLERSRA